MSQISRVLVGVGKQLESQGCEWALMGGVAVAARTRPRFTQDIDIAVAVQDDAQAEDTVRALREQGYEVLATVEQESTNRLATVRLIPPGEDELGVLVDLLFASSGIESEIVKQAEVLEVFPSVQARLPRVGHLIAVKVLARDDDTRPQDLADLRSLIREADDTEIERAREAIELIRERGFDRGRSLADDFEALLGRFG